MLNVLDFGAKGDGATDDTSAIQSAIYAAVNSGEALNFPAATYLIAGFLSIPSQVVLTGSGHPTKGSNLRFTGDGGGAWSQGVNGLIRATLGGLTLRGLSFEVVNQAAGACILNLSRSTGEFSGALIENCRFLGGGPQSTNTCLWGYSCDGIQILGTKFQYAAQHVTFGPHTVAGLTIQRCVFSEGTNFSAYMLDVNVGGAGFACSVRDNIFELYYSQLAARLGVNNGLKFESNYVGDGSGSANPSQPSVLISSNGPAHVDSNCFETFSPAGRYFLGVHCPLGGAKLTANSVQGGNLFITGPANLENNMITGTALLNSASVIDQCNYFRGAGHSYQQYGSAPSSVKGYQAAMDLTSLKIDPKLTLT